MELKKISLSLKQSIARNNVETLELSPYAVGAFLEICHEALYSYICFSNEQLGTSSEAYITKIELEKIESTFRELALNFFPMAHTETPLRDLKIIDKRELYPMLERLNVLTDVSKETSYISREICESIERLIDR